MDERQIMAIDLGTSKIALTVAKIEGDNIQILYYKETPSDGIRYSRVINPARAAKVLREAIKQAEDELGIVCKQVVVGYPKYEVVQKAGKFVVPRNESECVTQDDILNLKRLAMDEYELAEDGSEVLLGAVAQSFNAGDEFQIVEDDVIGMTMSELEGNFRLFIGQSKYSNNIDVAFDKVDGVCVGRKYFLPDAIAKGVLYDSEMDNGVALIDLGAGVTSVSIYSGSIMRHYAAIPFGGKAITNDIRSVCGITETLAENIKLAYGACIPDRIPLLGEKILLINMGPALPPKQVSVKYLSQIINARATEIIEAVLYEIQRSGFANNLKGGIVITGGGANLLNISELIKEISGYNVRIGNPKRIFSGQDDLETSATALIGMILMAKDESGLNCTVPMETEDVGGVEEGPTDEYGGDGGNGGDTDRGGDGSDEGNVFDQPADESDKTKPRGKKKRKEKKKEGTWVLSGLRSIFSEIMEDEA